MRNRILRSLLMPCCVLLVLIRPWVRADEQLLPAVPAYVIEHWESEFTALEAEILAKHASYDCGEDPYENERILDRNSCILSNDRTPFDVEYRRTCALVTWLIEKHAVDALARQQRALVALGRRVKSRIDALGPPSTAQARHDYLQVAALRRTIAFSNPLLDFDRILFVGRGNYYGDDPTGQHQLSGPIAFCNRVGGGLYTVENFKTDAKVRDLLERSVVKEGTYADWRLSGKGSFYSPELSYDGQTVLFAWSENAVGRERVGWGLGQVGPVHQWPPENVWHIFKVRHRWF